MSEVIVQPLLLGLSVGIFCFTYCIPFIAPYIVSEKREFKKNTSVVFQFVLGRLGGYILFGAIFGYLGERINNQTVNFILMLALIFLSAFLILYALGFLKSGELFCSEKYFKFKKKIPIIMGFLMGINICPPFLMSLAYVFTLHSVIKGIIYFLLFFVGTTVYFLPIIGLGFLGKMEEFRKIARISALLVGFAFLFYGIYYIIEKKIVFHLF